MAGKYIKKVVKNVGRQVRRRYFKKGAPNMTRIIKDVKWLKSVLNPEKKSYSLQSTDTYVGQCNVNTEAYYCRDITPMPNQNALSTGRSGNSIRLHATYFKYQLQQMSSSAGNRIKFKIMICKTVGTPLAAQNIPDQMFKNNSFVLLGGSPAIIDYNSDRREDTYKQFVVLRSKTVTLGPSQHSTNYAVVTGSMGVRYKSHHVKFQSDNSTILSDGQIFLLIMADNGNISQTTNSTLAGTQTTAFASGALLQTDITHWYYDN